MQLKKRRTEITIETETVVASRSLPSARWVSCPECNTRRLMLTVLTAAQAAGVSTRSIYQLVENGTVHAADMPDGQLLICHDSLNEYLQRKAP